MRRTTISVALAMSALFFIIGHCSLIDGCSINTKTTLGYKLLEWATRPRP